MHNFLILLDPVLLLTNLHLFLAIIEMFTSPSRLGSIVLQHLLSALLNLFYTGLVRPDAFALKHTLLPLYFLERGLAFDLTLAGFDDSVLYRILDVFGGKLLSLLPLRQLLLDAVIVILHLLIDYFFGTLQLVIGR